MSKRQRSHRFLLFWRDHLLDSRTVPNAAGTTFALPSGDLVTILSGEGEGVAIEIAGERLALLPGQATSVGELSLVLDEEAGAPKASAPLSVDANFLHTSMVVAAAQLCAVSALLFSPPSVEDMGGGITTDDIRRLLRHPADRAEHHGPAVMVSVGHKRDEGERIDEVRQQRGAKVRHKAEPTPSVSEVLAELERLVNEGARGYDFEASIGDIASLTPTAQELAEGAGGLLAPRPMLDDGVQSGLVGTGLDIQIQPRDYSKALPKKKRRKLDLKAPEPTAAEAEDHSLLAQNRDEIAAKVRERSAAVRYCYETRALQRDPTKTGRIVLEFSLQPNGYIDDVDVHTKDKSLAAVAECVTESASDWFLGTGLVQQPRRLSFPFVLQPRGS